MSNEKTHFAKYLDEALGLGIFMFSAGFFDMLIECSDLPVKQHIPSALLRRLVVGFFMGLTGLYIFTSKFGKASGAYINPSVTWVRYLMGDIDLTDSIFYTVFQFVGGTIGMYLVYLLFPVWIKSPEVNYIVTVPGKAGLTVAFLMESAISFLFVTLVLFTGVSKALSKYTPWFVSALIVILITFEAPYSGMSTNPARTFASAIVAGQWTAFWIYCTAPTLGMLSGAFLFVILNKNKNGAISKA